MEEPKEFPENVEPELREDLDILWLLLGSFLVFFMQCGFALLEAGTVRSKNTKNILLKNVLDACVGALIWWSIGHSFAYGENGLAPNSFIGGTNFFMSNSKDVSSQENRQFFAFWLFQWAFAATSGTIVSGAVAERCKFAAYLLYTTVVTGFIYPVVVHWVWSGEGWLSAFRKDTDAPEDAMGKQLDIVFDKTMGLVDFAGSGVVHMTGGGAALVAAWMLGPRVGRFQNGKVIEIPGHSIALASLGVFILWFSWYGFNPASTLCMVDCMYVASKTAVTTTLSASASGVTVLVTHVILGNPADVAPALNGILAGLVSITAGCAVVEPYGACVIGMVGGVIYYMAAILLKKLLIDDPLDASPVHFFCGVWGVFAVGLFATPENLVNTYGRSTDVGVLYGGKGHQLAIQILGIVVIGIWTIVTSGILFFTLRTCGWLRVPREEEIAGLDISHHGGHAYSCDDPKKLGSSIGDIAQVPHMPNIPNMPHIPGLPNMPNIPNIPHLPNIPDMTMVPGSRR